MYQTIGEKIITTHNAGFFSCCSLRLSAIIMYLNQYHKLPKEVDSSNQFQWYKSSNDLNMIPLLFTKGVKTKENDYKYIDKKIYPIWGNQIDLQFSNYNKLSFEELSPLIDIYFKPSNRVCSIINNFEKKYKLEYENLCGVFYRGNDKNRETKISSYDKFLNKMSEIKHLNPTINFLIQPDETEFLEECLKQFPNSIYLSETPHIKKTDTIVPFTLSPQDRPLNAMNFFAATILQSKCEHLITHSGNGGMWVCLYRGNMNNVHQILNDEWQH